MRRVRHHNDGLRKRCGCPRKIWPKCPHGWHFNYKQRGGPHYRISLDRELGRHVDSKTEAEAEAARIRVAIDEGTFRQLPEAEPMPDPVLTFRAFAELWRERRGKQLVRSRDNDYRLKTIMAFDVPGRTVCFGDLPLDQIRTGDIEAFRDARKSENLSTYTINHDLKLLRKMFNWGNRMGYVDRTPFKIGTEPAISLDREIPRDRRFQNDDDEQKLLDAADPHLRAVIVALLDTACRLGELLSLQWRDVNLQRRELTVQALKSKTRTSRIVPISTRLLSILEMRKLDPAGRAFWSDAYVFGNEAGEPVKSVRRAWNLARTQAGLADFQLRDLRHEAGSRFDEAGVSTNYVSKILGHTNLSTTTRYLNIQRRGLHLAMEKLEESRRLAADLRAKGTADPGQKGTAAVAQPLHKGTESAPAFVSGFSDAHSSKPRIS